MASIGWKKFKLFEDIRYPEASLPQGVVAACIGTDDDIWLACNDGLVVCLNHELAIKSTFQAYKGAIYALSVALGKLIALGEDEEGSRNLSCKAWDVGTQSWTGTTPSLLVTAKAHAVIKPADGELTKAVVSGSEWPHVVVALGTSTGGVHVLRADASKSTPKLAPLFGRYGLQGTSGGVTALHIAGSGPARHLFALSSGALAALSLTNGTPVLQEDGCGAGPGASAVTPQGELVVAGDDAVYFYTAEEGRKSAVAVRSQHALMAYKRYIATVVLQEEEASNGGHHVLRIYDVENKLVAASVPLSPPVQWSVAAKDGLVVADAAGNAVKLQEKSLHDRLGAFYHTRAFQIALKTVLAEGAGPKIVADVRHKFGDFLYSKRDYDGAVEQYVATIGFLPPSYVIQKFLDAQRIHNLTTYLEAVHAMGLASGDHTTLLLNCYTKLRDDAKVVEFVRQAGKPGGLRFDADAAVAVLREAGFYEQALHLAQVANKSDAYVSIMLEDCHKHEDALCYIRTLGRRAAADILHRHGKALLESDPVATTALLMELCLPAPPSHAYSSESGAADASFVANLADFTHLYTERPEDLRYACVAILAMGHPDLPSRQTLYHTLLDLYLEANGNSGQNGNGSVPDSLKSSASEEHDASKKSAPSASGRAEALDLLLRGWPPGQEPAYDIDRALTTCRMHSFHEGLVFLFTNLRLYREAANVLAGARDWEGLLELCERHGSTATGGDPGVWHEALECLSSPASGPGAEQALKELLGRIEAQGVMPPLVVLPVLARNPHLRLELVKDCVSRALQAENRAIEADLEEAERLKAEVERAEADVQRVTTEPVVFQSNRDAQTGAPLELPSVHFMCGHSFNLRTLGDGEGEEGQHECPICAPEHRRIKELQRSFKAAALDTDAFFRQLRAAPDGFGLVAEYFGKGMLNG